MSRFYDLFRNRKTLIGMIHLAGSTPEKKLQTALNEIRMLEEEGFDGALVEDYHGGYSDVFDALKESAKQGFKINLGVNLLSDPYSAFKLASDFGARFIQFDSVQKKDLDLQLYKSLREKYQKIIVLGGIGFKYTTSTGNPLEIDLEEGKTLCDAIVTTGAGTGIETPIAKLEEYRRLLKDFPLIVGAGVNLVNAYKQMQITNGIIIGSGIKEFLRDTKTPLDRQKIREIVKIARSL